MKERFPVDDEQKVNKPQFTKERMMLFDQYCVTMMKIENKLKTTDHDPMFGNVKKKRK